MPKWKTQAVGPSASCENGGCVWYERRDVLLPPPRPIFIAGFKSRCAGHTDPAALTNPDGLIEGFDGELRNEADHLAWEYDYILFVRGVGPDPATPPGLPLTAQQKTDILADISTARTWGQRDNRVMSQSHSLAMLEATIDEDLWDWWFEGVGDDRILHVDSNGQLNNQQKNRVSAAIDVVFGLPTRLVWEG